MLVGTLLCYDLEIDLHKYDVYSILSDDVLSYDSIEDNLKYMNSDQLSIVKDSSIAKMNSFMSNDEKQDRKKFTKIHNIVDYQNYFAMLVDYEENEEI